MNHKLKKVDGGVVLTEEISVYDDLNDGDEYVILGKNKRVVLSVSESHFGLARVIWDYGVRNREKYVSKFRTDEYNSYKAHAALRLKDGAKCPPFIGIRWEYAADPE
jgi:hypothetical protein